MLAIQTLPEGELTWEGTGFSTPTPRVLTNGQPGPTQITLWKLIQPYIVTKNWRDHNMSPLRTLLLWCLNRVTAKELQYVFIIIVFNKP